MSSPAELWLVTFRLGRKIARFAVTAAGEREAIEIAWRGCQPNEIDAAFRVEHGSAKLIPEKCFLLSKAS